jgi:hypothetical protein
VELAVVKTAERNGELVADLAAEGELLGKAQVVRLGGLTPADQARSRSDILEVIFIAKPSHFPRGRDPDSQIAANFEGNLDEKTLDPATFLPDKARIPTA